MNKLYAFLAIGLLSACGSSGIDGTYSPSDSSFAIEITGDKAMLISRDDFNVITNKDMCSVEGPDEELYTLVCDGGIGKVYFNASKNFLDVVIGGEVVQFFKQK
tara:strand:- start:236 stop:547 length:312 start_codon:yes stop_codon:yes gene_type:complete